MTNAHVNDFGVVWEVNYYDHEPEKIYYVTETVEAKDLSSLINYLIDNGMEHEPENETPTGLGDFNIEWILIEDASGKEVWRDPDQNFTHYNAHLLSNSVDPLDAYNDDRLSTNKDVESLNNLAAVD